jgi:bifunctional NMN adenylyltransferase/nudix hydrolase
MAKKPFHTLVFIGRFQPFHNGHKAVIDQALEQAEQVLVLVGSANRRLSVRNPFSFNEREEMIFEAFSVEDQARIKVASLNDYTYDEDEWVRQVQKVVKDYTWDTFMEDDSRIGLIGRNKDNTSYYLKLFPQWESVEAETPYNNLDATFIRSLLFDEKMEANKEVYLTSFTPLNVSSYLLDDGVTSSLEAIREEHIWCENYKAQWTNTPYPVTFITVDAVVVQSGHVLLVKRKDKPGQGLWALPGGYLNPNETFIQGCMRELKEETRIDAPKGMLFGSVKAQRTFDDIHRDPRGRFITHAFLIALPANDVLPKVKGGDDAVEAKWVPLSEIKPETLFLDHSFIIESMLKFL